MVRRRISAVSNHEARTGASSFETRSALLRMRDCQLHALTESEDDTEEESACASRWIICSTKL
jgi:hypothetical protein